MSVAYTTTGSSEKPRTENASATGPSTLVPVPAISLSRPSLFERARSLVLWSASVAFFVPMAPLMTVGCLAIGPDAMQPVQRFFAKWQLKMTGSRWKAFVHPRVDPKRAYLFAQNHTNHFDFVLMNNATPHYKQGVELEEHFKIPFYGWFMKARGGIPVRKGQKGQTPEVLAHMRREIDAGHAILVFPEGTRTLDGRVARFRTGSFFIARDLGLPVCPVAVTGAYDLMRKGSATIRPVDITVYVEEPFETAGLSDDEVVALAARVEEVVKRRVDDYWRERGWQG